MSKQAATKKAHQYVVCVKEGGDELSVLKGKLYRILDPEPNDRGYLRVVDETGEDYLYDPSWFRPIDVPQAVVEELEAA
jgi:hypothetical protein